MGMAKNQLATNEIEDERRLVSLAQGGDHQAFDHLINLHQGRIINLAQRLLSNHQATNRDDAYDVAQEVFIKFYRHLDQFNPTQQLSSWLYRITVNTCHDFTRSQRRRTPVSLEEVLEERIIPEPAGNDNVEKKAILRQEQNMILKALATLTEKERVAIVLRDIEGLSSEEVAAILGSSPTTVRSQISSARSKLRQFRKRWLEK
ncbi:MAG: hypothetical protein RIR86_1047 [Acidobacteriota bacterium]|jgi:RNA polymerase sigma-70 factor (ECF subfamily)